MYEKGLDTVCEVCNTSLNSVFCCDLYCHGTWKFTFVPSCILYFGYFFLGA